MTMQMNLDGYETIEIIIEEWFCTVISDLFWTNFPRFASGTKGVGRRCSDTLIPVDQSQTIKISLIIFNQYFLLI